MCEGRCIYMHMMTGYAFKGRHSMPHFIHPFECKLSCKSDDYAGNILVLYEWLPGGGNPWI